MTTEAELLLAPTDRRGFLRRAAGVAAGATAIAVLGSTGVSIIAASTPVGAVPTSPDPASNLVANWSFEQIESLRQPTGWTIVV